MSPTPALQFLSYVQVSKESCQGQICPRDTLSRLLPKSPAKGSGFALKNVVGGTATAAALCEGTTVTPEGEYWTRGGFAKCPQAGFWLAAGFHTEAVL